jgi:hypothetical protein
MHINTSVATAKAFEQVVSLAEKLGAITDGNLPIDKLRTLVEIASGVRKDWLNEAKDRARRKGGLIRSKAPRGPGGKFTQATRGKGS